MVVFSMIAYLYASCNRWIGLPRALRILEYKCRHLALSSREYGKVTSGTPHPHDLSVYSSHYRIRPRARRHALQIVQGWRIWCSTCGTNGPRRCALRTLRTGNNESTSGNSDAGRCAIRTLRTGTSDGAFCNSLARRCALLTPTTGNRFDTSSKCAARICALQTPTTGEGFCTSRKCVDRRYGWRSRTSEWFSNRSGIVA